MPGSTSLALLDEAEDDFDLHSRLAILRRAVAELVIGPNDAPFRLSAARAQLVRYGGLSQIVLGVFGETAALASVRRLTRRLAGRLPSPLTLEDMRRQLHAALVRAARASAASDSSRTRFGADPELDAALSTRSLLSDFHGSLLSITDHASLVWALRVADAELSILLRHPALERAPEPERSALSALRARTKRWRAGKRDADFAWALYGEVVASSNLLVALSERREVRRHDDRVLHELSALFLSSRRAGVAIAGHVADKLASLRGLDAELDRLMLDLPLRPAITLGRISRRVRQLRARPRFS